MAIPALEQDKDRPFGDYEEEAIISLIIDHPDFFGSLSRHLSHQLFYRPEVQYVAAHILDYYEKYDVFPTRGMLKDIVIRNLTVDDEYAEDILEIVDRESNPREIPKLKERLLEWARNKAYGKLYDPDTISRFHDGDIEYLHQLVEEASRIQDIGTKGLWFFDEMEKLFIEEEKDRFTTGIYRLDKILDEGGPGRKEMLVTMAPTGVGKCHTLKSKIIEKKLSIIYEMEMADGQILELAGYRKVQTTRGIVKVCDLTEGDDIIEIPNKQDIPDILLPNERDKTI